MLQNTVTQNTANSHTSGISLEISLGIHHKGPDLSLNSITPWSICEMQPGWIWSFLLWLVDETMWEIFPENWEGFTPALQPPPLRAPTRAILPFISESRQLPGMKETALNISLARETAVTIARARRNQDGPGGGCPSAGPPGHRATAPRADPPPPTPPPTPLHLRTSGQPCARRTSRSPPPPPQINKKPPAAACHRLPRQGSKQTPLGHDTGLNASFGKRRLTASPPPPAPGGGVAGEVLWVALPDYFLGPAFYSCAKPIP